MENLAYALVQWIHNFGAVAVTAGAVAARWPVVQPQGARHRLAWLVCIGWAAQFASGASFGAVSLHYYGQLPNLADVARAALVVKVGCAACGLVLSLSLLGRGARWSERGQANAWRALAALAVVALSAAAFLRWFA